MEKLWGIYYSRVAYGIAIQIARERGLRSSYASEQWKPSGYGKPEYTESREGWREVAIKVGTTRRSCGEQRTRWQKREVAKGSSFDDKIERGFSRLAMQLRPGQLLRSCWSRPSFHYNIISAISPKSLWRRDRKRQKSKLLSPLAFAQESQCAFAWKWELSILQTGTSFYLQLHKLILISMVIILITVTIVACLFR